MSKFYRCGSIIVSYDLVFDSDVVPPTTELTQTLQDSLNSGFIEASKYKLEVNSVVYQGKNAFCKELGVQLLPLLGSA